MRKKRGAGFRQVDSTTADISEIVDASRRVAARSVNAVMTATYWAVGRRIAEQEQRGGERAPLPDAQMRRIAGELQRRFGKSYSVRALRTMRAFFAAYAGLRSGARAGDRPVVLGYSEDLRAVAAAFSLSWSHYVQLVKVEDPNARNVYEREALRQGWTVRQLAEQIRAGLHQRVRSPARAAGPAPGAMRDEILRDPYLRRFFDVPAEMPRGDGSSRARDGIAGWLDAVGGAGGAGARDGGAAYVGWLQ